MIRIRRTKFIFKKTFQRETMSVFCILLISIFCLSLVSIFLFITGFDFFVYHWFRFFCLSLVSSVRANGQTSALDSIDGGHTLYKLSWWNKILAITPTSLTQHHVSFFRNLPLLLYCSGYMGLERKKRCGSNLHSTHRVPLLTLRGF